MNTIPIARQIARSVLLLIACAALAVLPSPATAKPGAQNAPTVAIGTADWCRDYEHDLLGLVNALTDSVLLNLRLAMREAGAGPAQVERVMSLAKHPVVAAYVEQKHGPAVLAGYQGLLNAVGCLNPGGLAAAP